MSFADPSCPQLRVIALGALSEAGVSPVDGGTVVVISGPRFSTRAESRWFARNGWAVVNMTQYPEIALARELGMCYVNISVITDYDAGLEGEHGIAPVSMVTALEVFKRKTALVRDAISHAVRAASDGRTCRCAEYAMGA